MAYLHINGTTERLTNVSINQASTPITEQVATTSWADVTYSSITYTPTKDSQYVLYEFHTYMGVPFTNDNECKGYFKFLYSDNSGSTWSELSNSRTFYGSNFNDSNTMKLRGSVTITQLIPYWNNTARQFKLQVMTFTDFHFGLHRLSNFYGPSGAVTPNSHFARPFVMCASI